MAVRAWDIVVKRTGISRFPVDEALRVGEKAWEVLVMRAIEAACEEE